MQRQLLISGFPLPAEAVAALRREWEAVPDADHPTLTLQYGELGGYDAYDIQCQSNLVTVTANSVRGAFHAIYELDSTARWGGRRHTGNAFDLEYRILHLSFNLTPVEPVPFQPGDIRFLSRVGASHCLVNHDWSGDLRHLQGYVRDDWAPGAVLPEAVSSHRRWLRSVLDQCRAYGLEGALWLTELPCQGGPWLTEAERQAFPARYPAEFLSDSGTYEGKVLCFGAREVRAYYRRLLHKFFADFPEIGILFVFGQDSGGRYCDPETCPRCHGMPLFDQHRRFIEFLAEEGARARPGLQVLSTPWGWSRLDRKRCGTLHETWPDNVGTYAAAIIDGWQCERENTSFLRDMRRITRSRKQLFIGYDNFFYGDDAVAFAPDIQDYPLAVAAKLERWRELGADGIFDHWGADYQDLPVNAMMLGACFRSDRKRPETELAEIVRRQFGADAAPLVMRSYRALERAQKLLSGVCAVPPYNWPGWFQMDVPTERQLAGRIDFLEKLFACERDSTGHENEDFGAFLDRLTNAWRRSAPHWHRAANAMLQAARQVPAKLAPGYSHWYPEGSCPTVREHLRRQYLYQRLVGLSGLHRAAYFELLAAFRRTGKLSARLLARDRETEQEVLDFFGKARRMGLLTADFPLAAAYRQRQRAGSAK